MDKLMARSKQETEGYDLRQSKVGDTIFQSSESSITCIKCSKPSITCTATGFSIETSNRKYQLKKRHQKSNRLS